MQDFHLGAFRSVAFMAIACYALVNMSLAVLFSDGVMPFADTILIQNPQVFRHLMGMKSPSDVILMGSSLMEVPLSLMDGLTCYSPDPKTFAKLLNRTASRRLRVSNASLEAGLVSDQYILIEKFMRGGKKPRIIVLGLGPRDFCDARWPSQCDTYTFTALVSLSDWNLFTPALDTFDQYLQFLARQLAPLYRFRALPSRSVSLLSRVLVDKVLPATIPAVSPISKPAATDERDHRREQRARVDRSYREYVNAYSTLLRSQSYQRQMLYLWRISDLCHERKLPLILVNLPITSLNQSLLPPGFYRRYQEDLDRLARAHKTDFLDLAMESEFKDDQDFWDTAHLNTSGGEKLTNRIVPMILRSLSRDVAPQTTNRP